MPNVHDTTTEHSDKGLIFMPDIREYFYGTSSESDVLSNSTTGLNLQGAGQWSVWITSSVVTCKVSATTQKGIKINAATVPSNTAVLKVNEVASYVFMSEGVLSPTISVSGTTGNWTALVSKAGAPAP
jgi:hypothetical protein